MQAENIVLTDSQPTPVDHTFVPLFQENGVWIFEDQSAATPLGYNKIMLSMTRPLGSAAGVSSKDRNVRVKVSVYTPILEVLSNSTVSGIIPAPTVSYVNRTNVEFILPERSTAQDRTTLRGYLAQLLSDQHVVGMVDSFQGIY